MRTVIVHLREATESEVAAYLSKQYRFRPGPGPSWVLERSGDPVLYIDFYQEMNQEFEVEDYLLLLEQLGAEPAVSVSADVSGRHPGDAEVRTFVCSVLQEFDGLAQDEYALHYWSREQILAGHQVQGHPFFDYLGWYNDQKTP